jgi:hypothetical protein
VNYNASWGKEKHHIRKVPDGSVFGFTAFTTIGRKEVHRLLSVVLRL